MSNNDKQDDKTPSEFPEKWNKILKKMPEFKDNADASSTDDLKRSLLNVKGIFILKNKIRQQILN